MSYLRIQVYSIPNFIGIGLAVYLGKWNIQIGLHSHLYYYKISMEVWILDNNTIQLISSLLNSSTL